MQAVILAGGKGTRLASRLNGLPKPLIDVCGEPLLARQVRMLERAGINDVIVLVNHRADAIQAFFEGWVGARVTLVDDGTPKGTAGAALAALDRFSEQFFVVYGDTLFDIDLKHMLAAHNSAGADATLFLHPNDHPQDSDLVEIGRDGWIISFHPYPHPGGADFRNLVNAAFYVCNRAALEPWRNFPGTPDFAKDLFPAMLRSGARLRGYVSTEYIKDLGTPARLDKVERHLREGRVERASRRRPQAAVFIDRDGTLNVLRGYVCSPDEMELLPGADNGVRRLNDAGLKAVLVTNQPVLARGDCDWPMMDRIHARLDMLLGACGAYLDDIRVCPHHPDGGFEGECSELKIVCACRKPAPGMIVDACRDWNLDPLASWMVGDSTADIGAAAATGLSSILVLTGEGGRDGKHEVQPDFITRDFEAAAEFIVKAIPRLEARILTALSTVAIDAPVSIESAFIGPARAARAALRRMGRDAVNISLPVDGPSEGVVLVADGGRQAVAMEDLGLEWSF